MSYFQLDDRVNTPRGQAELLGEFSGEFNKQYELAQGTADFRIVAYGTSAVNPVPFNPGQEFVKSIPHQLGYAPRFIVISFFKNKYNGENGFFPFPYYDGTIAFTANSDEDFINVMVKYKNTVDIDAYTYQFAYYIYNRPAVLG